MDKSIEDILKTEYSERFDKIRKDMMVMSYYKYGAMKVITISSNVWMR